MLPTKELRLPDLEPLFQQISVHGYCPSSNIGTAGLSSATLISRQKLAELLCPEPVSFKIFDKIFDVYCSNGNAVDIRSFFVGLTACCFGNTDDKLRFCFRLFDTKKENCLTRDQIVLMLTTLNKLSDINKTVLRSASTLQLLVSRQNSFFDKTDSDSGSSTGGARSPQIGSPKLLSALRHEFASKTLEQPNNIVEAPGSSGNATIIADEEAENIEDSSVSQAVSPPSNVTNMLPHIFTGTNSEGMQSDALIAPTSPSIDGSMSPILTTRIIPAYEKVNQILRTTSQERLSVDTSGQHNRAATMSLYYSSPTSPSVKHSSKTKYKAPRFDRGSNDMGSSAYSKEDAMPVDIANAMFKATRSERALDLDTFLRWVHRNPSTIRVLDKIQFIASPDVANARYLASEERSIIEDLESRFRENPGDTCHLLSVKWWRYWKSYCEYDHEGGSEGANHEFVLPPGPIDNNDIVRTDSDHATRIPGFHFLKENLVDGFDYVAVSPDIWKFLHRWYGGGPDIVRQLAKYGQRRASQKQLHKSALRILQSDCIRADLYPLVLRLGLLKDLNPHTSCLCSTNLNAKQLEELAYRQLSLTFDSSWRLWMSYKDEDPVMIEDLSQTVSDLGLATGHAIFLGPRSSHPRSPSVLFTNWVMKQYASMKPETSVELPEENLVSGLVGLENMGNTCFLNAALQSLAHTYPLTDYFLQEKYRIEFRPAKGKTGGKVTDAYVKLLKQMWKMTKPTVLPQQIRGAVLQIAPQFKGGDQQDSQELLGILLDCLHNDLNWLPEKLSIENPDYAGHDDAELATIYWNNHLLRDASVIVAMFEGQFKSHTQCVQCHHEIVKFHPFMFLSLPVPESRIRVFQVVVVRCNDPPIVCKVGVHRSTTIQDITGALERLDDGKLVSGSILLADVQGSYIFRFLNRSQPVADIRERDLLYAFLMPASTKETVHSLRLKTVHRSIKEDKAFIGRRKYKAELFGSPSIVTVEASSPSERPSGLDLYRAVAHRLNDQYRALQTSFNHQNISKMEDFPFYLKFVSGNGQQCSKCASVEKDTLACVGCLVPDEKLDLVDFDTIAIEWKKGTIQNINDVDSMEYHASVEHSPDPNLYPITLDEIIREYEKPEWMTDKDFYCSKCKAFCAGIKRETIWKFPPFLMIQLKRFAYTLSECVKNQRPVAFPKEHFDVKPYTTVNSEGKHARLLDLIPYLKQDNSHLPLQGSQLFESSSSNGDSEDSSTSINPPGGDSHHAYRLYSVISHLGSFHDGHYITHACDRKNEKWYMFNDENVPCVDLTGEDLSSPTAYVLFYQRKNLPPLDHIRKELHDQVDALLKSRGTKQS